MTGWVRASAVAMLLVCVAVPSRAQEPAATAAQPAAVTVVRTARDQVLVWARNPSRVMATLPAGVELDALSRAAQWVEVLLPEKFGGPGGARGFVYHAHVTYVSGPPLSSLPNLAPAAETAAAAPRRPPPPRFGIRGYGEGAYQWFTAADSFKAILDTSGGFFYGGGAQVYFGPIYVDVGVSRFEKTGERAFVFEGDVVPRRDPRPHHDDAAGRHGGLSLPRAGAQSCPISVGAWVR